MSFCQGTYSFFSSSLISEYDLLPIFFGVSSLVDVVEVVVVVVVVVEGEVEEVVGERAGLLVSFFGVISFLFGVVSFLFGVESSLLGVVSFFFGVSSFLSGVEEVVVVVVVLLGVDCFMSLLSLLLFLGFSLCFLTMILVMPRFTLRYRSGSSFLTCLIFRKLMCLSLSTGRVLEPSPSRYFWYLISEVKRGERIKEGRKERRRT